MTRVSGICTALSLDRPPPPPSPECALSVELATLCCENTRSAYRRPLQREKRPIHHRHRHGRRHVGTHLTSVGPSFPPKRADSFIATDVWLITTSPHSPSTLKEASIDSPTFRGTVVHFNEQADHVEKWVDSFIKAASKLIHELLGEFQLGPTSGPGNASRMR